MSISGILSGSLLQNQLSGASGGYQKQIKQLSQDLTSGNLTGAQSDFAALQKAFSSSTATTGSATAGTSTNTAIPASQAFNQFVTDLQSGNLSAAQNDLAPLQPALPGSEGGSPAGPARPAHHYHHLGGGGGSSTTQNDLLQDLSQATQTLTSSNSSGAQQAYAGLQQQLTQFALSGGALATQQPVSFDA